MESVLGGSVLLLLVFLTGAAWVGLSGRPLPTAWLMDGSPLDLPATPEAIGPAEKPNRAVACGAGLCPGAGMTLEAPLFRLSPDALAQEMRQVAEVSPRTEIVAEDADGRGFTAVQRTSVIGFPDTIRVWCRPAPTGATPEEASGPGRLSTLAILSRSRYGYSDLGVNEKRVRRWLKALSARVGPA